MSRITTERGNGKKENGSSKKEPAAEIGGVPDFNATFARRETTTDRLLEDSGPDIECRVARPSEIQQLLRDHYGVDDPDEVGRIEAELAEFVAESRGSDTMTSNFTALGMSVRSHVSSDLDRVMVEELGEGWDKPLTEPPAE